MLCASSNHFMWLSFQTSKCLYGFDATIQFDPYHLKFFIDLIISQLHILTVTAWKDGELGQSLFEGSVSLLTKIICDWIYENHPYRHNK